MEVKPMALVLADISGYTGFMKMHTMSILHAEQIITDLLETVIDHAEFPLAVSKIEGDAVFFYAAAPAGQETLLARDVLKQVAAFIEVFKGKQASLTACATCSCEACQNIDRLRLKAILHYGDVVVKRVKQFEELAGENVVLAHRLLKNSITSREYILLTEAYHKLAGDSLGTPPEAHVETLEGLGSVKTLVYNRDDNPDPAPRLPARAGAWAKIKRAWAVNQYSWLRVWRIARQPQMQNIPARGDRRPLLIGFLESVIQQMQDKR